MKCRKEEKEQDGNDRLRDKVEEGSCGVQSGDGGTEVCKALEASLPFYTAFLPCVNPRMGATTPQEGRKLALEG